VGSSLQNFCGHVHEASYEHRGIFRSNDLGIDGVKIESAEKIQIVAAKRVFRQGFFELEGQGGVQLAGHCVCP
jgi:hypothetical protein